MPRILGPGTVLCLFPLVVFLCVHLVLKTQKIATPGTMGLVLKRPKQALQSTTTVKGILYGVLPDTLRKADVAASSNVVLARCVNTELFLLTTFLRLHSNSCIIQHIWNLRCLHVYIALFTRSLRPMICLQEAAVMSTWYRPLLSCNSVTVEKLKSFYHQCATAICSVLCSVLVDGRGAKPLPYLMGYLKRRCLCTLLKPATMSEV